MELEAELGGVLLDDALGSGVVATGAGVDLHGQGDLVAGPAQVFGDLVDDVSQVTHGADGIQIHPAVETGGLRLGRRPARAGVSAFPGVLDVVGDLVLGLGGL